MPQDQLNQADASPGAGPADEWVLVPRTPTDAMLQTQVGDCDVPDGIEWMKEHAAQTWAEMLAAAPQAPVSKRPPDGWVNEEGRYIEGAQPTDLVHSWKPVWTTPASDVDEQALRRLTERGAEAWKDVPDSQAWVEEQRGNIK